MLGITPKSSERTSVLTTEASLDPRAHTLIHNQEVESTLEMSKSFDTSKPAHSDAPLPTMPRTF